MIDKKLNVLYISSVGYWGGVERFLNEVFDYHKKVADVESRVLFLNGGEFHHHCEAEFPNIDLYPAKIKLKNFGSVLKFRKFFRQYIKDCKTDIVHCSMPYSFLLVSFSLLWLGKKPKVVFFEHGPIGGMLDNISVFFKRDYLIANSKRTLEIANNLPLSFWSRSKQDIVYPAIDLKKFDKEKKLLEKIQFISVSRIARFKGIHQNIRIFAYYHMINPRSDFRIFGVPNTQEDKVYLEELKNMVKELKLGDSVQFMGHSDDVPRELSLSHVFIHAPVSPEAFGISLVEAMASKTIVVSKKFAGQSEFLTDQNCIWVEGDNETAKKIDEVLKNKEVYQEYINHGYNWVVKNIDKNIVFQKLTKIYKELA